MTTLAKDNTAVKAIIEQYDKLDNRKWYEKKDYEKLEADAQKKYRQMQNTAQGQDDLIDALEGLGFVVRVSQKTGTVAGLTKLDLFTPEEAALLEGDHLD